MEMQELTIVNGKEVKVIDSREVDEMMGKEHKEIMWYIDGNEKRNIVGIRPTLASSGIELSNYFIESTYNDRGRTKKRYLVTKKGAELLGGRLQGTKGIIFNTLFNDRFKAMECDGIKNDVQLVCETLKETHKRPELEFLDMLEETLKPFNIKGERQFNVLKYRIDFYIPSLNIAIEYDENNHNNYSYDEHEGRQIKIEKEIGCRFIRVSDSNGYMHNVGQVIKEIFNLSEVA